MSDQSLDQTTFVESIDLRDEAGTPSLIKTSTQPQPEEMKAPITPVKKKLPTPVLIAIGVLVFLVLLTVIAFALPKRNTNTTKGPEATKAPLIGAPLPTDLQKSIDALDDDIKMADPQNNDLPFPPVNFQLHLVPPASNNNR